ncbi:MAG: outer membrane beta-barrel protein [Gemmatimonadaceae bacterium]
MKRSIIVAALVGIALVSLSTEARAQVSTVAKPVQFGIAAGAAIPTSDLSNAASTGFNVTGTIGVQPSMIPLGVRIDGAYNRFSLKNGVSGDIHFTSVTGNLVYKIPSEAVSPYLIGGAGWYNAGGTVNGLGGGSSNHFGWNLGGGISMPLSGFDTFLEARYNQVQGNGTSLKYIPITFGVMF